ncbi:methyltransferase domain-containing protein [Methylobacterium sp. 17Sr1-1]|uniref:class I SAM-dependent DNA methyltransferase n=1 Tax=Methylobacterium sp. 17Sr1-1 TaxID=2202826 RepID=UPI000D6F9B28|nr:methyltransferase domain-containing protein [Methylobacterium sp. 17Sr1-1]AWN53573.1 SAM-dependent methyltransferase [Methylobacterium sp. 17Sr1-1]
MPAPARSSGDLLADRRYAWAEAVLADGDAGAAADLAAQVLERAPGYAPAWLLLGRARAADPALRADAPEAFRAALALDPEDSLGARLHLVELGLEEFDWDELDLGEFDLAAEEAISPAYVRALFDGYAGRFERHLVEGLGYRGPALIREALERLRGPDASFPRVLDLGCGTGLMARALDGIAGTLAGIDLSPGMLAEARRTGLYARLHEGDLRDFLRAEPPSSADLAVAADVFIYLREIGPVLRETTRVLAPGGLFAFTVQGHAGARGTVLGADGRYAHGVESLQEDAAAAGLRVALLEPAEIRRQNGAGVPGWLAVLAR